MAEVDLLQSAIQRTNDTDHPSNNNMAVLQGVTATLAQLAKASETQTAILASLKEDILLRTDSDEEQERGQSGTVDISAIVNDMLDPSDNAANAATTPALCP